MISNQIRVSWLFASSTALLCVGIAAPVCLEAQEHYRDMPIARLQSAKYLTFGEVELNSDSPDWRLPNLVLELQDEEQVRRELDKRAQEKVQRLNRLYGLDESQAKKLSAAASIDIHRLLRLLDGREIAEKQQLGIRVADVQRMIHQRLSVQTEFFDSESMFEKVLRGILGPAHTEHRKQELQTIQTEWLRSASRKIVVDWLALKTNLSTGQRVRMMTICRPTFSPIADESKASGDFEMGEGQRLINQLHAGDADKLDAILREDQLAKLKASVSELYEIALADAG